MVQSVIKTCCLPFLNAKKTFLNHTNDLKSDMIGKFFYF